jgi:hypothetical protein
MTTPNGSSNDVVNNKAHDLGSCNRVRLSAKGDLILCLGQEDAISLKDAVRSDLINDEIKTMIVNAIFQIIFFVRLIKKLPMMKLLLVTQMKWLFIHP